MPFSIWKFLERTLNPRLGRFGGLVWDKGMEFGAGTSGVQLGLFSSMLRSKADFRLAMSLTRDQFTCLDEFEQRYGVGYGRMLTDTRNYLVDNVLAVMDRTSMAASVEARVPLLDHRLVERAFSVPEIVNIGNSFQETKISLKTAMRVDVPSEILNRPKIGFNGPVYEWLRQGHPALKDRILNPGNSVISDLFNTDTLNKVWSDIGQRQSACENLFMIYIADLWLESHA